MEFYGYEVLQLLVMTDTISRKRFGNKINTGTPLLMSSSEDSGVNSGKMIRSVNVTVSLPCL